MLDQLKGFLWPNEGEEEYEEEEYTEETLKEETGNQSSDDFGFTATPPLGGTKVKGKGNTVVNISATTQLKVVLVKPENFSEAGSIADHLNAKRTVVLNLENTNREVSRRLVDFLSGVAYANNGQIKRVAANTFIITPFNVGIMGDDIVDGLESNGVFL